MKQLTIIFLALIFASAVNATGKHKPKPIPQVNNITNQSTVSDGVALSIAASQHHFDWSTDKLQGSIGAGYYDSDTALSVGIGQRFGKDGALVNGSIGWDGDEVGAGVGATFRF